MQIYVKYVRLLLWPHAHNSYIDFHFYVIGKETGTINCRTRIRMFMLSTTVQDTIHAYTHVYSYHVPDFVRFSCQGKMDSYLHIHYKFIGCMLAILAVEKRMVYVKQPISNHQMECHQRYSNT